MEQEPLVTSMLSELAYYIFFICAIDCTLSLITAEMRAYFVRFSLIMMLYRSTVCF